MKFPPGRRRSGRSFWLKELQAPSTWTLTATSAPVRTSKTPDDTATRTLRWGGGCLHFTDGLTWLYVLTFDLSWRSSSPRSILSSPQIYFTLHPQWQRTNSFAFPLIGYTLHTHVTQRNEWGQGWIKRKRRREEWQSVFVWGANEPTNSMNRWLSRFTVDSSAFKVRRWCVTCNASHWQDITQLCLAGLCCSCQYSRFASPLACIALP